jgi:hypothetical protein
MVDAALIAAAFATCLLGFALLALSQKQHLLAVLPGAEHLAPPRRLAVRWLAGATLAASLAFSGLALGPSFGSLLGVLAAGASAATVTLVLAFRPRWFFGLARLMTRGPRDA